MGIVNLSQIPSACWLVAVMELHNIVHGRTQGRGQRGGGAVRGSEGHTAVDDLASEKGHLLGKRALFSHYRSPPPPPLGAVL